MNWRFWLPFVELAAATILASVAHRVAQKRRDGKDCGDYWAAVVRILCYWFGPLLLLSIAIESAWPVLWSSGWHLQFDRVLEARWAFPLALGLPFFVWAILLVIYLSPSKARLEGANWLAGSIGFTTSRRWLIHCIWILLIPLLWFGRERLGLGTTGYPAAIWSSIAVVVISLVAIAISTPSGEPIRNVVVDARSQEKLPVTRLVPWPEALSRDGLDLDLLVTWQAAVSARSVPPQCAGFAERLRLMGAQGVAPQVTESFTRLLTSVTTESRQTVTQLLFGPDDCGQIEALALTSYELLEQFGQLTLIITPHPDPELLHQLRAWLTQAAQGTRTIEVLEVNSGSLLAGAPSVWLLDAATLSEDFMSRLTDPAVVNRIGLVVWWDVHTYTGVLAANLWAISRRLHRIMQKRGDGIRTIATVRYASHPDAQLPAFVRRLLPYSFDERETHVEPSCPHDIHVYHIRGQNRASRQSSPERFRHLALAATYVSAAAGYVTHLKTTNIPNDERLHALDLNIGQRRLGDLLVDTSALAEATIIKLSRGQTLCLREAVAQGGRAVQNGSAHYVGLILEEDPYADYLLKQLTEHKSLPASRRLVGAEGHEAIFRRHLLLALSEQEDTRTSLLHSFLWEERIINRTLDDLARENRLSRRRVRYLDMQNNRVIEDQYKSLQGPANQKRPLDAAGDSLVLVREAVASAEQGGIRMRVDPERMQIQAYPQRVFFSDGYRYRIRDWSDRHPKWVECTRDAINATTWRIREPSVSQIRPSGEESVLSTKSGQIKRFPASVQYQETADGVLNREHVDASGTVRDTRNLYQPYLFCSFQTKALVLHWLPAPEEDALRAVCLALRHILPVHIGVEEDALEVVPMLQQVVDGRAVNGMAIVDLYPFGIGVVDAICDDQLLIQSMLMWARNWLSEIGHKQKVGAPASLYSPLAVATGGAEDAQKGLALLRTSLAKT